LAKLVLAQYRFVFSMNPQTDRQRDVMYQFDDAGALLNTHLPLPRRSGKVRDVYDLGDSLLIVSTDRISAFDYILPCGIPEKGKLLTAMSQFWFGLLPMRNHLRSSEVPKKLSDAFDVAPLVGRVMVVDKAEVVPFECVVRGYLEGSGLKEYRQNGKVCGIELPPGLVQCDRLSEPIFTPATKAETGHDENVSFERMEQNLGAELAQSLRRESLAIYTQAAEYSRLRGILIADTKFEFGFVNGELTLVDEVLTPDSSRFWPAAQYQPGRAQSSFDKQFVREWLSQCGWDKNSPPPPLPEAIRLQTAAKYREAFERLTA
jgi:phosphoribosylaminoimidazole-succinocarboxamide synthase